MLNKIKVNDIVQERISTTNMQVVDIKDNIVKCCWIDENNEKYIKEFDIDLLILANINSLIPSLIIDGDIKNLDLCN